jgi:hypothetical protein
VVLETCAAGRIMGVIADKILITTAPCLSEGNS